MKLIQIMEQQKDSLKAVDWDTASFKAGVILRLIYETLKPIVTWTAAFFSVGIIAILTVIIHGIFGKR